MQKNNKITSEEAILSHIYEGAMMGTDTMVKLIEKTEDKKLVEDITCQMNGYQNFANMSRKKLVDMNVTPKEASYFTKIPAVIGTEINTAIDNSPSHIAEMIINGSTMGIIELKKEMNRYSNNCADDVVQMGNDMLTFEENNVDRMKRYL